MFFARKAVPFDAAAILSGPRNGAIAFCKVGRSIWAHSVESQPAPPRSSVANREGQERAERVLGGLKNRFFIDVHWKYEFPVFEEETHGHLSQLKPLKYSLLLPNAHAS
jgi:hypothetical protein